MQVYEKELAGKKTMFSCSGGDSNCGYSCYGITGNIHICHRSFYFDIPEYMASLDSFDKENWDISTLESGNIDLIKNTFIVDAKDEYRLARYEYVMRGYHDFWNLQLTSTAQMARMLATIGQCDERFINDDRYLSIFSTFMNVGLSCPMENALNTGSVNLVPVSMIRMFGNGAFREILNEL
jgi:hypothetical protein